MNDPLADKHFLTHEQLADLLISRHLQADKKELIMRLASVNYYRLTGYLYTFRETVRLPDGSYAKGENYRSGTTLDLVWRYYLFDRRLRLLLIDAVERIEIALRAHIAHDWAQAEGCINPQEYPTSFNTKFLKSEKLLRKKKQPTLFGKMQASYEKSQLDCSLHFKAKGVTDAKKLPAWVLVELTTIGELLWLFGGLKEQLRRSIAAAFGVTDLDFFESLLTLLHQARNACAHHGRIWNAVWQKRKERQLPNGTTAVYFDPIVKQVPPSWNAGWEQGAGPDRLSTAFLLTACSYLLKQVAPTSEWQARFKSLTCRPELPCSMLKEMGFSNGWRKHILWN